MVGPSCSAQPAGLALPLPPLLSPAALQAPPCSMGWRLLLLGAVPTGTIAQLLLSLAALSREGL